MANNLCPVLFLMGPTASGKTDLVTQLYDTFHVRLISVDSAQVYRDMDIGTGKPDKLFLSRYPHHLIDIRSPNQSYSAADFRHDALMLINDIKNKIPVFVGGTMFYFSVLEKGLSELPPSDQLTRTQIKKELELKGLPSLYNELITVDPVYGKKIQEFDTQRICRAIEIYRLTGNPPSKVISRTVKTALRYPLIKLTLFQNSRRNLHQQISQRFNSMISRGLIDETKKLLAMMTDPSHSNAMKTIGYRQVYEYLKGIITYDQMIIQAIAATRQLAKRQLTWLRHQSGVVWCNTDHSNFPDTVLLYLKSNPLIWRYALT